MQSRNYRRNTFFHCCSGSTVCMYACTYDHYIQQSMDQPGKVANSARPETSSAVPSRVSLLNLHTRAESGAYSRDSS